MLGKQSQIYDKGQRTGRYGMGTWGYMGEQGNWQNGSLERNWITFLACIFTAATTTINH